MGRISLVLEGGNRESGESTRIFLVLGLRLWLRLWGRGSGLTGAA